ncbi:MAG: HAMP domain-containing protein [Nocardioidaceae bacterium]|nr:HAMP domain-containing protein [Nocardioidaceae bacterium]NUS52583.1 HAMP domain-containing protein [Nocardioidaceae bacterium]
MPHRFAGVTAQVRTLVVGMVLLVAVAGLAGLVGVAVAIATVSRLADEVLPASDANHAVLQRMTDAETGLRGWVATDDDAFLQPYQAARRALPAERRTLRRYAADHPGLRAAVARQDRAVSDWFQRYAEPRLRDPAGPGNVSHQRLLFGKSRFDQVRSANAEVEDRLNADLNDARLDTFQQLPWVVAVLVLVAFLGGVASLVARRVANRISEPLVDMERTVDRLAAGETDARAAVGGPREVRRVGEALNNFADQNARLLDLEREAVTRLKALDRAKTDFVSNVSHELRTPLTSIAGYVELFEDGFINEITPQQRAMLQVVSRNVERLRNLIEDLLSLSQVEAQAFRTSFDVLDLNHLVSDTAHDLGPSAAQRRVTLTQVLPPRPMVMRGDASQLSRALLNLLSNAVKFSHEGGEVTVRVRQVGPDGYVEVSDRGIGIPADDMSSLATRFFRASNAVDAEIGGTGLGLRIVNAVLDNHNGRLEMESVEGEGTTARMVLPLAADTVPEAVRRAAQD